jgi:hypothetical protein
MKTPEEKKAYMAQYRATHREELNAKLRKYRAEHKEKIKEINHRNYIKSERSNQYMRLYGISEAEFEAKIVTQNGRCPIGDHPFGDRGKKPDSPCLDHNHKTGVVRAVLCNRHNVALGGFRDSLSELLSAAEYLDQYDK